jgi:hypothetical protein
LTGPSARRYRKDIMPIIKAPAPPGLLNQIEVEAVTIAGIVGVIASVLMVAVGAIQGSATTFGLTHQQIALAGTAIGVILILVRSVIAAGANAGIAAKAGVLTRVEFYVSTWVGAGMTVLAWGTALLTEVQGAGISALGISDATLGKIGAAFALATVIGHGVQLLAQNWGFSSSQIVPATGSTPPAVNQKVVFTRDQLAQFVADVKARAQMTAYAERMAEHVQSGPEPPVTP